MNWTSEKSDRDAYFPYGLQITEKAWQTCDVENLLEQSMEDPISPQLRFARLLSTALNQRRDFSRPETRPARAGELLAMMLLLEIFRYVVTFYCRKVNPVAIGGGLSWVRAQKGTAAVDKTLPAFVRLYPPLQSREQGLLPDTYLLGITQGVAHKEIATQETLLLQLMHENPAVKTYLPLFDNRLLRATAPYQDYISGLDAWFETQPPFPDTGMTLMRMLREIIGACPDSLEGQLEFVTRRWRSLLPDAILERLLVARGALREETMMRGFGPGPVKALAFEHTDYAEPEAFTQDEDWMPHVVLIAKLAYVWLDQLSLKYGRHLTLLSDIPDQELDQLAHWGFNALWLIGVWERSSASRAIKQRMGNPEAAASAYSLYDYTIAQDLGGEEAFADLARRAGMRGIKLAGDMVPNHMGIFSKWVVEHPNRFLQLNAPPFPGYHFTGPDLSSDHRVSLRIEDGYWDHSDAAVVFQRVDNATGDTTYIYHGNDGTSMPWNDTAQLNFLMAETREAVIRTIIEVARRFPIIRFDAAMTLAKRHYQRLWFPKPGEGGAIPSRAGFAMTRAEFDTVFPAEFWREVVDRIAAEAPDTLLLAEAFWLMEGYFVRTLGMHRVYNSAFMNMLKMEDNAKYRQTIKNVLEFSPEVLQRFVNFMNNPDEDTAEAQFGKGDKYFGVAAMLATMPGLPMFGHGQIEGFTEKYGMEYRRAYRSETVDAELALRHEREIFPLLRKRYLFSGAKNFALFDLITPNGWVDENVFAYTNRSGDERALFVYHNVFGDTRGVLHTSTAINEGRGEEKKLHRRTLAEALALNLDPRYYTIMRDSRSRLEYLHHNRTLADMGLHLELHAFHYTAFTSMRQVCDMDQSWGRLHGKLAGRGVPSVEEAYLEMHLSSILDPFREMLTAEMLTHVLTCENTGDLLGPWRGKITAFYAAVADRVDAPAGVPECVRQVEAALRALRKIIQEPLSPVPIEGDCFTASPTPLDVAEEPAKFIAFWRVPAVYCLLHAMGSLKAPGVKEEPVVHPRGAVDTTDLSLLVPALPRTAAGSNGEAKSGAWMREWLLVKHVARVFESTDEDAWRADLDARLAYVCVTHREHLMALNTEIWGPVLHAMMEDPDTRAVLRVNRFANKRWLNKEQLEHMLHVLFLTNLIHERTTAWETCAPLMECMENIQVILETAMDASYDFDMTLGVLK